MLTRGDELAKGILNAQEARDRSGTFVDHIEPVAIAQIAGFNILVLGQFNVADLRPPLDLDGKRFPVGPAHQQIKARPLFQARRPRLTRR